ncbi:MAG: YraN family protein [Phormidesmis sp. CAN_BIN36]|nr:YraN family protein [Phormidesmis sp. CAN_BIN36]
MNLPESSGSAKNTRATIGILGEEFVADWLRSQDWQILHYRWHCRFGEIDVIAQAQMPPCLTFVEVKTRSKGNWDGDGLLAITPSKQKRLWQTAQLFLMAHPDLETLPCRFDVALVRCQSAPKKRAQGLNLGAPLLQKSQLLFSVKSDLPVTRTIAGYHLTLHQYIPEAFTF